MTSSKDDWQQVAESMRQLICAAEEHGPRFVEIVITRDTYSSVIGGPLIIAERHIKEGGDGNRPVPTDDRQSADKSPPASASSVPGRAQSSVQNKRDAPKRWEPPYEIKRRLVEEEAARAAGESADGIVSTDIIDPDGIAHHVKGAFLGWDSAGSPVGTAPGLPSDKDALTLAREWRDYWLAQNERGLVAFTEKVIAALSPPPPAELGLETSEEERRRWADELSGFYPHMAGGPMTATGQQRLLRDFDRQAKEITRLNAEMAKSEQHVEDLQIMLHRQESMIEDALAREAAARAEEREACAKIADAAVDIEEARSEGPQNVFALKAAAAIRARSKS